MCSAFHLVYLDINEPPSAIVITSNLLLENSARGTVVGELSVSDEDRLADGSKQQHTYSLIDNPNGLFRISGKQLQVSEDNSYCIKLGGAHCKLNFEDNRFRYVKIQATDNGIPAQSFIQFLSINLKNVNDPPRNIRISSNIVPENASLGFVIGEFKADDEDSGQRHTFLLLDDDNGRFVITNESFLVKANQTNYESSKSHKIIVQATDNGTPPIAVWLFCFYYIIFLLM